MRLVCPNCEAKYEVPDDAIPDTGRDVQCASCGHAWFQMRPRAAAAVAEDAPLEPPADLADAPEVASVVEEPAAGSMPVPDTAPEVAPEPVTDLAPDLAAEPVAIHAVEPTPGPEGDLSADVTAAPAAFDPVEIDPAPADDRVDEAAVVQVDAQAEVAEIAASETAETASAEPALETAGDSEPAVIDVADEGNPPPDVSASAPYAVDESVLAILREEAEREAQARRAEGQPLERQTDLGLTDPPKGPKLAVVPDSAAINTDAFAKPTARRDLLPDVEEINSTLRPSELAADADGSGDGTLQREARGGFRSGFLMVMTLAIIGAAVYITAPQLSAMIPSLADPLNTYVDGVDSLRLALDGMMRSATVAINGL